MNSIIFSGTVSREPHFTDKGKTPALFISLASTRKWNDKTFTSYGDVAFFGDKAKQFNGTVRQGDFAIVQGEAQAEIYEHGGEKKAKLRINAMSMDVVNGTTAPSVSPADPLPRHPDTKVPPDGDGSDVPF